MSPLVRSSKRLGGVLAGSAGAATAVGLGQLAPIALGGAIAAVAAAFAPSVVVGLLLFVVVVQDWLVATLSPLAQRADEALLAVGLAGIALRSAILGRISRTPLDAALLAFLLLAFASAALHGAPAIVGLLGILAVAKGPLAFALVARTPVTRAKVARAGAWLVAIVAALAAVGVAQRLGGPGVYAWTGRWAYYLEWQGTKAPSLFLNHNTLGHACVLGGLLAVGLALRGDGVVSRRLCTVAGIACLAGLVVSASRESWLAAAAALLAGAWLLRSRRLLGLALLVTLILACGAVIVYFASPLLREEIARRGTGVLEGWHLYRLGFSDWAYRGEYRVYVILKSWQVFLDHWLLGTGPGRYGGQVALVYGSPLYERYAFLPLRGAYHPLDVFWSRLLAEFGVLGSAAYLWAWVLALRLLIRSSRSRDGLVRGLGAGGTMAWVAVVVIAVFAPALEDALVTIPIWSWAAIAWSLDVRTVHGAGAT